MRSSLSLFVLLLLGNALPAVAGSGWVPLPNAPTGSHFEDAFFVDPLVGWVVDGAGRIHRTTNGGDSWQLQVDEPAYLRSVGFADAQRGWAGNLNGTPLLFATTNGGAAWTSVLNIPEPRPTGICGIWVVNASVVYGCGRYDATTARVIKTTNGGATWTSMDLAPLASSLIDCYFFDENRGFVVGGIGEPARDGDAALGTQTGGDTRRAVILGTTDGGATWTTRHTTNRLGEWCWKISFPTPSVGYVSIERFSGSTYFLKTTDGGLTWAEHLFRDNYIVQGIGFVTPLLGWTGGPTGPTYESTDAGASWHLAGFGVHLNRFRFLGPGIGYAVGQGAYKYTSSTGVAVAVPELPPHIALAQNHPNPFQGTTSIGFTLASVADVKLSIIDAHGRVVRTLLDARRPPGTHELSWSSEDGGGDRVSAGVYWYRLEAGPNIEVKKLLVLK
jgi:photosystem II stability/assembly factor-like uncharacterized protein